MMRHCLTFSSCTLHLVAFVLFLLTSLSGYAIKGLYLFIFPTVPGDFEIDLSIGVLGFCDTHLTEQPTSYCFGPSRGYTISPLLVDADGLPLTTAFMLDPPLVSALVLHPICTAFAALCIVLSVFGSIQPLSISALWFSVWNAILATVAFGIDIAVVVKAKNIVDQGIFVVYWGAVPWMTLAAAVCTWISVVLLTIRLWKYGGSRKKMNVTDSNMHVAT